LPQQLTVANKEIPSDDLALDLFDAILSVDYKRI